MSRTLSARLSMSQICQDMTIPLSEASSIEIFEHGTWFNNIDFIFLAHEISNKYAVDGEPVEFGGVIVAYADIWIRNDVLVNSLMNGLAGAGVDGSKVDIRITGIDGGEYHSIDKDLQERLIKGLFSKDNLEATMYITHN